MSTIQEAAANTVFRIANLYEQNCALKHGLPKVGGPDRIGFETAQPPENANVTTTEAIAAESTAIETPSPGGGAAAVPRSSLLRRAAPLLLASAVAAGVPAYLLWPAKQPTPPVTPPIEQPKDGDLLQWLQSQGRHLPQEGSLWQTK